MRKLKENLLRLFVISTILIMIASPVFSAWTGSWTDNFDIAEDHSTVSTGYTYGNWSFSEHINSTGSLEEAWTESNNTQWTTTDHSSWWAGNYTLEVNTTDVNNTFAVLNTSGMNRSQVFGWVHTNDTEVDLIYPYVIFAYNTSKDFDCVMWSSNEAWLFHWNGTNMSDIPTGDTVVDPSEDGTDLSNQWVQEGSYINDEVGNYYKVLYNELNGSVKFKWWGTNFMAEPVGWDIEYTHINITETLNLSHGIGIWNPNQRNTTVQYDLIDIWQLNYTVNHSASITLNGTNHPRPHMEFPSFNLSNFTSFAEYINYTYTGNFTAVDAIRDIMKNNITNLMSMESRMWEPLTLESDDQNDTVYYYSCLYDNFINFTEVVTGESAPAWMYDEYLHLHVQVCPDGDFDDTGSGDFYDDLIIAIDVDNDGSWDSNDRLFWMGADGLRMQLNGDTWVMDMDYNASVWLSNTIAVGNLHRYESFMNYGFDLPLSTLVKNDTEPLNVSDVFGLNIMTFDDGAETVCVWQNWNETTGEPIYPELTDVSTATYFLNYTESEEDYFPINSTTISHWGEGVILGAFNASGETVSRLTVQKVSNVSTITEGSTYALINYTIWINNTGATNLTNVVVNDTKFNCTCHDFNETVFTTNVSWDSVTNYSCYREFNTSYIEVGESWQFWYAVNISNCSGTTYGTLQNNVSVNATQLDTAVTDSNSVSWGIYATELCVKWEHEMTDVGDIGNSVFIVIGIIFVVGSILLLVGLLYAKGFIKF